MKIVNLMEDTKGKYGLYAEHGLSIYIETENHKFLVDTGASEKTWSNAKQLGIDLTEIDTVFLSHGHYDHSGGILSFAGINSKAKIYMHNSAVYDYYNLRNGEEKYIGINKDIMKLTQCVFTDSEYRIDSELSVYCNVTGRRKWPKSNLILKRKIDNIFVQDSFDHEQYVVVEAENKKILISGCAHNGILNILDRFRKIYMCNPDIVISGFHMMKNCEYMPDEIALIRDIASELKEMDTLFYTGHCTGLSAFEIMKEIMGEQLQYMHSGEEIF